VGKKTILNKTATSKESVKGPMELEGKAFVKIERKENYRQNPGAEGTHATLIAKGNASFGAGHQRSLRTQREKGRKWAKSGGGGTRDRNSAWENKAV